MQAEFWNAGISIASSEVPIFFRAADRSAAISAIGATDFFPPAYEVAPNGECLIDFLGPYVHWQQNADLHAIVSADYSKSVAPAEAVIGLCASICSGLVDYAADQVIASCTDLSSLLAALPATTKTLIPSKLAVACDFLLDFTTRCMKPLEYGTPLVHQGTSQQHKSWWRVRASHLSHLAHFKARRKVDFPGVASALQSIDRWIDLMHTRLVRLNAVPLQPAQIQAAVVEASAYCAAVAERHLMRSHHGQAILHLHRSVDLLLFALCDGRSLIDHSSYGGRYVSSFAPATGANQITLKNSYDAVKSLLAYNATREGDFSDLNDWRNLLMHTHYMTGLDDSTARSIFGRIRPHLRALGSSQWRQANDDYLKGVQLTVADLLDVDQSLTSTVQRIAY